LAELPSIGFAAAAASEWHEVAPEDLKIVIVREPDLFQAQDDPERRRESPRHAMRRRLHSLEQDQGSIIELLASRRTGIGRKPAVAVGYRDGRRVARALFLEALGAAIVPDLTELDVEALESEGAIVLDNAIVSLDPADDSEAPSSSNSGSWHLAAINVAAARAKDLTGKGALIGVVDTGIDASHPEFSGQDIHFRAFKADGTPQMLKQPKDYGRHGTHVAALCAGKTVGVAPDAELAVAAVLTTRLPNGKLGGYRSQIIAGMNWLARGGAGLPRPADIINASLGGISDVQDYIVLSDFRVRGVAMVAAIGNDGRSGFGRHSAPGMFDCTVAVGAVDRQGVVADFSAWGQCYSHPIPSSEHKPDVVAPGVGVVSAVPGAKYQPMNGTSMASPIVAGAAALLLQQNPGLRGDPEALGVRILSLTAPLPTQPNGYDVRRGGRGALDLAQV
jgi:subtilisin family serine protease